MTQRVRLTITVSKNQPGRRLDRALAEMFLDYSRSRIKERTLDQYMLANDEVCDKPREKVLGGEQVTTNAEIEGETRFKPQSIPLDIVYEDEDIIAINRPRGLVVHPGTGNPDGTVLNALLHHYPPVAGVSHTGTVHRLDKGTTGLMVMAKTVPTQTHLVEPLQRHGITRECETMAISHMTAGDTVDGPTSHHPTRRTHMAVHPMDRPAVTHYRIMEHLRMHTHPRLRLETGRTHRTRVHMAHTIHPLIGDLVYNGRPCPPRGTLEAFISTLYKFNRQVLHATMLRLYHSVSGIEMKWYTPIPQDMAELIEVMRADFEEYEDEVNWL